MLLIKKWFNTSFGFTLGVLSAFAIAILTSELANYVYESAQKNSFISNICLFLMALIIIGAITLVYIALKNSSKSKVKPPTNRSSYEELLRGMVEKKD
jgi:hypothetical protein